MDKQAIKQKLIDHLNTQRDLLVRSRDHAKVARDTAPSAMESHSDTTRSEMEKLVFALEKDIETMNTHLKIAQKTDPEYLELTSGDVVMKVLLVQPGIGGKKIEDIILLSPDSPLGAVVSGKKPGDKIEFNGRNWRVG